jgi:thioredoxin reductase
MSEETKIENVIIIGSAPPRLTPAVYTARPQLYLFIIDGQHAGGQLINKT